MSRDCPPPYQRHCLAGVDVWLDHAGAMFVPSISLLVVSDLHFEKGSYYAERGQFLPPYDTRATLKALAAAIERYRPKSVLTLGDTFHDQVAEQRMAAEDIAQLEGLCRSCDWIFLLGNHDPLPPERFTGRAVEEITLAGLTFTHEPREGDGWHVAGHLHPAATVRHGGARVRRRCFVSDGERLVMPAFGAFTGGLNVLDPAFGPVLRAPRQVVMCGETRPYRVPSAALVADGRAGPVYRLKRA